MNYPLLILAATLAAMVVGYIIHLILTEEPNTENMIRNFEINPYIRQPRITPQSRIKEAERFVERICEANGFTIEQIKAKNRKREVVLVRQIAMYFTYRRYWPEFKLEDLGRIFEKDHTTILHSVKKVEQLMEVGDVHIKSVYDTTLNEVSSNHAA